MGVGPEWEWMPHWHCVMLDKGLILSHTIADALIFLSYISIPLSLLVVFLKRRDYPFVSIAILSGMFIVSCGATHAFDIVEWWLPVYFASACVKWVCAVASVGTAFVLWKNIPFLVGLVSEYSISVERKNSRREIERLRLLYEESEAENAGLRAQVKGG